MAKTTIYKGETVKLNVTILPEEAALNRVIYSSSNSNIAAVDSTGNITGVTSGTAAITVKSEDGKVSKSITVNVYSKVTDVSINSGDITLQEGETFKLNAIIFPDDATNKDVEWSSSNSDIAGVNSTGLITANAIGTATITVTAGVGVGVPDSQVQKSIKINVIASLEGTQIVFNPSLKIDGNVITGLDYLDTTVKTMKSKISTDFAMEFYNYKGELLNDSANLGTGSKILFRDADNNVMAEYNIVLYGDVNRRRKNK